MWRISLNHLTAKRPFTKRAITLLFATLEVLVFNLDLLELSLKVKIRYIVCLLLLKSFFWACILNWKDVIKNTIKAIADLTFLGTRILLDFGFCGISVKNSNFKCEFHPCFLREMKSKFKEKYNLYGTVKDLWSKPTVPLQRQPKRGKKKTQEQMYHQMTKDMFSVKKIHITN